MDEGEREERNTGAMRRTYDIVHRPSRFNIAIATNTHIQTPTALSNNALSMVCLVALDILPDSGAMFSETVIVARLPWDLASMDTLALEFAPSSSSFISTWLETSFATVSRRMMSD